MFYFYSVLELFMPNSGKNLSTETEINKNLNEWIINFCGIGDPCTFWETTFVQAITTLY